MAPQHGGAGADARHGVPQVLCRGRRRRVHAGHAPHAARVRLRTPCRPAEAEEVLRRREARHRRQRVARTSLHVPSSPRTQAPHTLKQSSISSITPSLAQQTIIHIICTYIHTVDKSSPTATTLHRRPRSSSSTASSSCTPSSSSTPTKSCMHSSRRVVPRTRLSHRLCSPLTRNLCHRRCCAFLACKLLLTECDVYQKQRHRSVTSCCPISLLLLSFHSIPVLSCPFSLSSSSFLLFSTLLLLLLLLLLSFEHGFIFSVIHCYHAQVVQKLHKQAQATAKHSRSTTTTTTNKTTITANDRTCRNTSRTVGIAAKRLAQAMLRLCRRHGAQGVRARRHRGVRVLAQRQPAALCAEGALRAPRGITPFHRHSLILSSFHPLFLFLILILILILSHFLHLSHTSSPRCFCHCHTHCCHAITECGL